MYKNKLDFETANEWFYYDETSPSALRWKKVKSNNRIKQNIAGSIIRCSRDNKTPSNWRVSINGKSYKVHAIIWLLHYKEWPTLCVDHINGDPLNNNIKNLRLATVQQNNFNSKVRKDSQTGVKGVQYRHNTSKFIARMKINRKEIYLGSFDTLEEAKDAYAVKTKELFGEFARS